MYNNDEQLPEISLSLPNVSITLNPLNDLHPAFLVPRLADKPQNPIMDTLKVRLTSAHSPRTHILHQIPTIKTDHVNEDTKIIENQYMHDLESSLVWQHAARQNTPTSVS